MRAEDLSVRDVVRLISDNSVVEIEAITKDGKVGYRDIITRKSAATTVKNITGLSLKTREMLVENDFAYRDLRNVERYGFVCLCPKDCYCTIANECALVEEVLVPDKLKRQYIAVSADEFRKCKYWHDVQHLCRQSGITLDDFKITKKVLRRVLDDGV